MSDAVLSRYRVGFTIQQFLDDVSDPKATKDGETEEKSEWKEHLCVAFPWIAHRQELDQRNLIYSTPLPSTGAPDTSTSNDSSNEIEGKILPELPPIIIGDKETYITRMKYR